VQVATPEQVAALHPPKANPGSATAVSVTDVPEPKFAEQVAPQLIPAGTLVTVPVPAPLSATVNPNCACGEKVATTDCCELPIEILQGPPPEQAPVQPANTELLSAAAVRVIVVPVLKFAEQVDPQVIPAGTLVTVPPPVPASVTFTGKADGVNSAATVCAAFTVTEQFAVPEHAPVQPEKTDPKDALAVRVTTVPEL
jgi:3D (Asp-Asp-Asp) domain-containing protein